MSPLTDRSKAKESGFAQIREALISFEGDVTSATFGQWGGELLDKNGKPRPPKEFLEVECINVVVLSVSEELAFIPDEWNFRVNCSDFKGSFWIEDFLASADELKVLIPEGLVGKRITWRKVTREAIDKAGNPIPEYASTNFIIGQVANVAAPAPAVVVAAPAATPRGTAAPAVVASAAVVAPAVVTPVVVTPTVVETTPPPAQEQAQGDPMEAATQLAVGKTETQFRSAISLHPQFVGSPLLAMAKAGLITSSLVEQGKLVAVPEGNKTVYRIPE